MKITPAKTLVEIIAPIILFTSGKTIAQNIDAINSNQNNGSNSNYNIKKTTDLNQLAAELQLKGYNLQGSVVGDPLIISVAGSDSTYNLETELYAERPSNTFMSPSIDFYAVININNAVNQKIADAINNEYAGGNHALAFFYGSGILAGKTDNEKAATIDSLARNGVVTEIDNEKETGKSVQPETIQLNNNYPNPFNPLTNINYSLSKTTDVKINIFNTVGQSVYSENLGEQPAGTHNYFFNAKGLPSGVYIYTLNADGMQKMGKMVLTK